MHEYSLAEKLVNTLNNSIKENNISKLEKVNIKIGAFSNISKELLEYALRNINKNSTLSTVTFNITTDSTKFICNDCSSTSQMENYKFRCKTCNSNNVKIVEGDEIYIESIEGEICTS